MKTRKPCPGCGQVVASRPAAEVCYRCRKLLADGARFAAEQAARVGWRFVAVPDRAHDWPYIPHTSSEALDSFQTALSDLVNSVGHAPAESDQAFACNCPPVATAPPSLSSVRSGEFRRVWQVPVWFPAVVERLYHAAAAMVLDARSAGHRSGGNLLSRLASGEISVDSVNDASAGARNSHEEHLAVALRALRHDRDVKLPDNVRARVDALYKILNPSGY